ncbi:MAG: hypothetical protein HY400_03090 [Elusimicrobia bacterium]|nr:hypothetical protein [Elusimicrobiota bacterium]
MKIRTKFLIVLMGVLGMQAVGMTASLMFLEVWYLKQASQEKADVIMRSVEKVAKESLEEKDALRVLDYLMFLTRTDSAVKTARLKWMGKDVSVGNASPSDPLYFIRKDWRGSKTAEGFGEAVSVEVGFSQKELEKEVWAVVGRILSEVAVVG